MSILYVVHTYHMSSQGQIWCCGDAHANNIGSEYQPSPSGEVELGLHTPDYCLPQLDHPIFIACYYCEPVIWDKRI
jgi:hypothetical protein